MPQIVRNGLILEVQPDGTGKVVGYADQPATSSQGRVFSLPPNPDDVRQEQRADEDQQLQREAAARAERAAERADKTANRQAAAAERTAAAQSKPTEYQAKSAGFLGRMMQADRLYSSLPESERGARSVPRQAFHNIAPGFENTLVNSPARQKADQALENFIAASLRQESGAAISSGEFDRQYKIFFPAPGDSPETIAQKAEARRQAIEGFRVAAGPLADQISNKAAADVHADETAAKANAMMHEGRPYEEVDAFVKSQNFNGLNVSPEEYAQKVAYAKQHPGYTATVADPANPSPAPDAPPAGTEQDPTKASILGQSISGANEGLADVLGAPIDLGVGAVNLGVKGINALAGTNIPQVSDPAMGSDWIKEKMTGPFIFKQSASAPARFARRVGESVGAAAVPIPGAGVARPLVQLGKQVLMGTGGGIGAATAQQEFPDNPLAQILGETLGMLGTGTVMAKNAGRQAARAVREAVPTVPELKGKAADLYRAAESRGVVASPEQTQELSQNFRKALADEGRVSPTGRVSEVYPKAKEAVQLIDDYAGHDMNPTQIQNVRKVVGDALTSSEPAERRLGGILTDVLDEWANPLAPELSQARDVASRYLTAEQLQRARELAGAQASQFTGSGFENALRTQYRGLDRAAIKGNSRFTGDVTDAIEKVSRGTPASNFFRSMGRLAPTGPVSGMGSVVPALAVGSMGGAGVGAGVGGTLAGAGILGRIAATKMGIKAADEAELIARNGGVLPPPLPLSPEWLRTLGLTGIKESTKYLAQ